VTLTKCGKVKLMKFFGLGLKSENNKVFRTYDVHLRSVKKMVWISRVWVWHLRSDTLRSDTCEVTLTKCGEVEGKEGRWGLKDC